MRVYEDPRVVGVIKLALSMGYLQEEIAAHFVINGGRVSEINTGRRGVGIPPAISLPANFPPRRR